MGMNDRVEKAPKRRKNGTGGKEAYDAAFVGYINLSLSDEEKSSFDAWAESASFWEALEVFPADGVHLSLKVDTRSGGYLASGTQRRSTSPNAGLVVTARAREAAKALGRLLFSLTVLSHYEKWEDRQTRADPDRW